MILRSTVEREAIQESRTTKKHLVESTKTTDVWGKMLGWFGVVLISIAKKISIFKQTPRGAKYTLQMWPSSPPKVPHCSQDKNLRHLSPIPKISSTFSPPVRCRTCFWMCRNITLWERESSLGCYRLYDLIANMMHEGIRVCKIKFWQRWEWDFCFFHHSLLVSKSANVTNKQGGQCGLQHAEARRFVFILHSTALLLCVFSVGGANSFALGIPSIFGPHFLAWFVNGSVWRSSAYGAVLNFLGKPSAKDCAWWSFLPLLWRGRGWKANFCSCSTGFLLYEMRNLKQVVIYSTKFSPPVTQYSDSWPCSLIVHLNLPYLLGWMMRVFYHYPWHKTAWVYSI